MRPPLAGLEEKEEGLVAPCHQEEASTWRATCPEFQVWEAAVQSEGTQPYPVLAAGPRQSPSSMKHKGTGNPSLWDHHRKAASAGPSVHPHPQLPSL